MDHLFHATSAKLGVGTRLFPRSRVTYSRGDPAPRVFLALERYDAVEWAKSIGFSSGESEIYVYRVEPLGRLYRRLDLDTGLEEGHCEGAIVIGVEGVVRDPMSLNAELEPCAEPAPAVTRGSVGMTLPEFFSLFEGETVPQGIVFEEPAPAAVTEHEQTERIDL